MYAEVLVELKAKNIDQTFTYKIPDNLIDKVKIGIRVIVPFGNQKLEGFVLMIHKEYDLDYSIKDILEVVDDEPVLTEELLEIGKYISRKTLSNLISSYQTMLPKALKAKNKININKKYKTFLVLKNLDSSNFLNEKQLLIINLIKEKGKVEKSEANKISPSSVKTLIKNNVVEEKMEEVYRLNDCFDASISKPKLNEEQKQVLNKILTYKEQFKPVLLHGVTGSGKTEVYMHLVENIIKDGKEAIVLVPEISLTPQLVNTFKNRFGSNIAILHSALSDGEKYDEWRKIERKEVSIVIGARSAIFAPFTNLGIIIVDEEHSTSYKQENNPRYHAIDVALYRAKRYNCPVVLGSATPSIESYTRAKMGIYELCEMKKRVNNNLPKVHLVEMRSEIKKGNKIISELLSIKINEALEKNEQVILLLNRRGYSTVATCKNCGYTVKCPHCDITLTYHKVSNTMRCHYCGYVSGVLNVCPECHSKEINFMGMGTEKLEQFIKENFKLARPIRMDNDTTVKKGSHEKIISAFKREEYNVLIGTQMISKGLDFPKVTVVGVINGDASLNIPDFRSAERTFALLNQVAGRAGRSDLEGTVIIQGFNVEHYSLLYASTHDYNSFYNEEMHLRKMLGYPPYYNLCLIKIKSKDLELVQKEALKIVDYLNSKKLGNVIILGPSFSTVPKVNDIYNMQVIIKFKKSDSLIKELIFINDMYRKNKVLVDIDLNPIRV